MFLIPNGASNASLQAQPDTVDWQILEQGVRGDGVKTTADLVVAQRAAGVNMSCDVAAGTVRIGTTTTAQVAATNVAIASNGTGNTRFDLVICDNTGTVSVIQGTAAVSPVFPAYTASSQLVLAAVMVTNGLAAVLNANIIDKRVLARSFDVAALLFVRATCN